MKQPANSTPRARPRPLMPLRPVCLQLAWVFGAVCGWRAWQTCGLLESVLRGSAAGLGALIVALWGIQQCERLLMPPPPAAQADSDDHPPSATASPL